MVYWKACGKQRRGSASTGHGVHTLALAFILYFLKGRSGEGVRAKLGSGGCMIRLYRVSFITRYHAYTVTEAYGGFCILGKS